MTATEVEHRPSGAMPMPGRPRGQPEGGAVIGSPPILDLLERWARCGAKSYWVASRVPGKFGGRSFRVFT